MKQVIKDFVDRRNPQDVREYDRALREIIQYIALFGLWRAGFFEHAAFYGGTALRILHGLPRFSEDIDFSLLDDNRKFSLESYLSGLKTELSGFGFKVDIAVKASGTGSTESAFIKANTRMHVLQVAPGPEIVDTVPSNQRMKVKLEVDVNPPGGFDTESLPVLDPIPFYVRTYSLPDLFAGKMHCVLFRKWRIRIKGRDWYDMIWFLRREVPLHLLHLEERMRQSGDWTGTRSLTEEDFSHLYRQRVAQVDFLQAVNDVLPFIQDPRELDVWSRDFFLSLIGKFQFS
jgi:predicted nucleotidyltransferase component of viral defense system